MVSSTRVRRAQNVESDRRSRDTGCGRRRLFGGLHRRQGSTVGGNAASSAGRRPRRQQVRRADEQEPPSATIGIQASARLGAELVDRSTIASSAAIMIRADDQCQSRRARPATTHQGRNHESRISRAPAGDLSDPEPWGVAVAHHLFDRLVERRVDAGRDEGDHAVAPRGAAPTTIVSSWPSENDRLRTTSTSSTRVVARRTTSVGHHVDRRRRVRRGRAPSGPARPRGSPVRRARRRHDVGRVSAIGSPPASGRSCARCLEVNRPATVSVRLASSRAIRVRRRSDTSSSRPERRGASRSEARPAAEPPAHQSGMLPCLRRGSSSRLVRSMARPATTFWRVSAGSITSSTYPRSAAAYGLA